MNVFDPSALEVRQKMYQGWVFPDLYPFQPQPVLDNSHIEDLAAFCGGEYTTLKFTEEETDD